MKTRKVIPTVAIVVEAGAGKEDRIRSGSYQALREEEQRRKVEQVGTSDEYLPDFLK